MLEKDRGVGQVQMQDVGPESSDDLPQLGGKVRSNGHKTCMCLYSYSMYDNLSVVVASTRKTGAGLETEHGHVVSRADLLAGQIGEEVFHASRNRRVIFTDMQYLHWCRRRNGRAATPRRTVPWFVPVLLALALLAGCAEQHIRRPAAVDEFIHTYNASEFIFQETYFDVLTLLKGHGGRTLRVYIEGDGLAWLDRHTVSRDPTPRTPLALELAALDPAPLILYLARPCQYVVGEQRRNCFPQVWTSARFSEPVVRDLNAVLDEVKARTGAERLELVGYSGGGGLAVLLAARRRDVAGILTLAGNLDHRAWTSLQGISPLVDSLNPADEAIRIAQIPQLHVAGGEDTVIPPAIARGFVAREPSDTARCLVMPGVGHVSGWSGEFPKLLDLFSEILTRNEDLNRN